MQFLRFCVVGGAGFLIDAFVTLALTQVVQWGILSSRALAFTTAATATWYFNRTFTFKSAGAGLASWWPYIACTAIGACINIGLYSLWLRGSAYGTRAVLEAVTIGSAGGLVFNFLVSKWWVFAPRRQKAP